MATVKLIITDRPDGSIELNLESDADLPANMKNWTSAMRAGMYAYHALGTPEVDLRTTDTEGEA
jgi:hypothetical protein